MGFAITSHRIRRLEDRLDNILAVGFNLLVARGLVDDHYSLNKFGRSDNVDSGVDTDIWDRANATNDQATWLAPTAARIHNIVSTSTADASAGTGMRTIKIYGLRSWDSTEVSETITLNGTTNVATTNSYVIIHRMKGVTWGTGGTNAGTITATAATDATVTAQIQAGEGQTQMAIYGVPRGQTLYLTKLYAAAEKASASLGVKVTLLANTYPDVVPTGFLTKHTLGLTSEGSNAVERVFDPPNGFTGPCIIKIRGNSSANDTSVDAGFDGILITE